MMAVEWTSLAGQAEAARRIYGDAGPARVDAWLEEELFLVDDLAFAGEFAAHVALPGTPDAAYAHRVVDTAQGRLLGGIRFYGRDIARPFVEVLAHTFADLDALAACVGARWAAFGVRFLRLRTPPGAVTGPRVVPDQTVHAAWGRDMRPDDGTVRLVPADLPAVQELVAQRYRDLRAADPVLARDISESSAEDLGELHAAGTLFGAYRGGELVGALGTAAGRIGWVEGQEVQDEVVATAHAGNGYAAGMQTAWAAAHPDTLLIGTVDHRNTTSRRSAERAGRPAILETVFVAL